MKTTFYIVMLAAATWVAADEPALPPAAARAVDFVKDVQPIFKAHCVKCHGPEKQKSDYRLEVKESALKGGSIGGAIVPGKSGESKLIEYVTGKDEERVMPPKGERLSAEQVGILRAWIDQGATWPESADAGREKEIWWSLRPLVRPEIPGSRDAAKPRAAWGRSPIDLFVFAKLQEQGMSPSPEADKRTLIRRVYFDLTGLPPTPSEVEGFLADASPDAYEKLVNRLLESPRYGERWARHWMDVVHFAETHGHDQDRPRPSAWPYRDYLIRSFNDDKPYARFVQEQIAGDALYPDDPWATVALGFIASGPWDESSQMGILDDTTDKKIGQMLDRDDMVTTAMSTFVSSTVHCARCHNHKFDPISQRDYYALQAVFAGVDRAERPYDPDPAVYVQRREWMSKKAAVETMEVAALLEAAPQSQAAEFESQTKSGQDAWLVLDPASFTAEHGSTATKQPDGSLLYSGNRPEKETYTITATVPLKEVTAVRLEVMADPSLPQQGPGRQDNGNLHLSEFRVYVEKQGSFTPVPIRQATADFNQNGWAIHHALDGNPDSAWGIYPNVGKTHTAVFELAEPLKLEGGTLKFELQQLHGGGHLIGRPRLSATSAANPRQARPIPFAITTILGVASDQRTDAQRAELARFAMAANIEQSLARLPAPQRVYAATKDFKPDGNFKPPSGPRPVFVLRRGDIASPIEPATPGALSCITGIEARFKLKDSDDEAARRAAFAVWLTDRDNVLTWRSIANRIWHHHLGRGIVDTPNDFGRMGSLPTHPELLDWLAVEFRDSGGSFKHLHRLILTSSTYRQSSAYNEAYAKGDADNRFLWRMNRQRLDAEQVRDALLQMSGKLDLTMGGPSVKQFIETPGIHVTPNVDYNAFSVDDPANHRRSVYRFVFRTLPDPFMEAMDCPDASQWTPVRTSSMTALQALAMFNNRFIVRYSEHLAAKLDEGGAEHAAQIQSLYGLAYHRDLTPQEAEKLADYARKHGLANLCRVVLNSNEFMFVD